MIGGVWESEEGLLVWTVDMRGSGVEGNGPRGVTVSWAGGEDYYVRGFSWVR